MESWDRFRRAAFVALAVGLAWGIRGDFGHMLGASYPGAVLGLAFAYVTGQDAMFRRMPILAALGAIGIALGGSMSYGILHGYAQADTFVNYAYGFFSLFLQGGTWGLFGCAIMGLSLEKERMRALEWLAAIGITIASGIAFYLLVVRVIGFQVNPPRGNGSVGFVGGSIGLLAWLAWRGKRLGLKAAILGLVGFGLGMSGGRLLGNVAHVAQAHFGFTINHWNVMECSVGIVGGFVFAWGMLGHDFADPQEGVGFRVRSACSIFYVLFLIPLLHRLTRVNGKTVDEWTKHLEGFGYSDPSGLSGNLVMLINVLMFLAFAGACAWFWLHYADKETFAWFPVICLSLTMLLFQNLRALYPLYPAEPGYVNMHSVFWIFFVLMALHVAVVRHDPETEPEAETLQSEWKRWAVVGLAGFVLVVFIASFVNGGVTMETANTRWPVWEWRSGPFPGTHP